MNSRLAYGQSKYALKDSDGSFFELDPSDMHRRIAGEIVRMGENTPTR